MNDDDMTKISAVKTDNQYSVSAELDTHKSELHGPLTLSFNADRGEAYFRLAALLLLVLLLNEIARENFRL